MVLMVLGVRVPEMIESLKGIDEEPSSLNNENFPKSICSISMSLIECWGSCGARGKRIRVGTVADARRLAVREGHANIGASPMLLMKCVSEIRFLELLG